MSLPEPAECPPPAVARAVVRPVRAHTDRRRDPAEITRPVHPILGVIEDRQWVADANCKGLGDLFFEPFGEQAAARADREARALALCRSCPVRLACRDAGRRNHENGIWGGETEVDRTLAGYPPRAVVSRQVARARLNMVAGGRGG